MQMCSMRKVRSEASCLWSLLIDLVLLKIESSPKLAQTQTNLFVVSFVADFNSFLPLLSFHFLVRLFLGGVMVDDTVKVQAGVFALNEDKKEQANDDVKQATRLLESIPD